MDRLAEPAAWVPESLKEELSPSHFGIGSGKHWSNLAHYGETLLHDPRMEKAWLRLTKKGVDPIDFFFFASKIGAGIKLNRNTKRKPTKELADWEQDVKRTARKLASLVFRTPYEQISPFTRTADHGLTKLLDRISRTSAEDIASMEQITSPGERRVEGRWIAREYMVRMEEYLRDRTTLPMTDVVAAAVNTLLGKSSHEEFTAHDVKEILANHKKAQAKHKGIARPTN